MRPRPVSQQARPAYPTRREFLAIGVSALGVAGISGCGGSGRTPAMVAPIFVHGEGRGASGCVVISPPVFLSEEEALQVVREEFARAGIALGRGMCLREVIVEYEDPDASWVGSGDNWLGEPSAIVSHPAELAAVDHERGIGVAIVTTEDCGRFRVSGYCSSASSYDTRELAEAVADAIRGQTKQELCVGVFYDPLETWDFDDTPIAVPNEGESDDIWARIEKLEQVASKKSRAQLRRQVQDFVAWVEKNR